MSHVPRITSFTISPVADWSQALAMPKPTVALGVLNRIRARDR